MSKRTGVVGVQDEDRTWFEHQVRTMYNHDRRDWSRRFGLVCKDDSKAVQASKDECDINVIVRRFGLTGQLPQGARLPTYGDFAEGVIYDYGSALRAVREADAAFMALPAQIRSHFANDAGSFVEFCSDEKNRPQLELWGLVQKKEAVYEKAADPTSRGAAAAPASSASGSAASGSVAGATPATAKTS